MRGNLRRLLLPLFLFSTLQTSVSFSAHSVTAHRQLPPRLHGDSPRSRQTASNNISYDVPIDVPIDVPNADSDRKVFLIERGIGDESGMIQSDVMREMGSFKESVVRGMNVVVSSDPTTRGRIISGRPTPQRPSIGALPGTRSDPSTIKNTSASHDALPTLPTNVSTSTRSDPRGHPSLTSLPRTSHSFESKSSYGTLPSSSLPHTTRSSSRFSTATSEDARPNPTTVTLGSSPTSNNSHPPPSKALTASSRRPPPSKTKSKSTGRPSKPATKTRSTSLSTTVPKTPPTSFGNAPQKGCSKPPSTFGGSAEGFASLCKVRYCDAKPRRNMYWSGTVGGVTREEIESALGMLMNLEPAWENGQGNRLGDGALGQGAYSASLLFEITGDIRALDVAVRIADNILALQNQNTENPVTIWTGEADPVWPTHELPPNNKADLIYAGCEQGEIVSNMVNAALLILKSPCLWTKIPPVFDGPTVFNRTSTYYDRALAYIAAGDDTYENYFFRFFDSAGSIIQPADERWWAVGDTRAPGTLMPWNRRMQIVHGALKLAAAHETPAAFDPNITRYYDNVVQRNVMDFLGALNSTRTRAGEIDIFEWDYSAMEEHTEEARGIHALWDIFGAFLAWQRSSAQFYLSDNFGKTMAQTFEYQINLGNGSFGGLVTGESTEKALPVDSLWGHWSFYGYFLPDWYQTVANANVNHGFQGRTWLAIPLLWTKHALYLNDLTFWTGRYSSGFGYVVGSEAKVSSTVVQRARAPRKSLATRSCLIAVTVGFLGGFTLLG